MHLSMFSPRGGWWWGGGGGGVAGIPWGLDNQSSHYPKNLTDNFGTGLHTCHKLWTEIYEIRHFFKGDLIKFCDFFFFYKNY